MAGPRVEPAQNVLDWAVERATLRGGRSIEQIRKSHSSVLAGKPTLKQLEAFAKYTYTPLGYFFLPEPPDDSLPIADFRTLDDSALRTPSPHLLDQLYLCERCQEWYRGEILAVGEDNVDLVGTMTVSDDHHAAARVLEDALGFDIDEQFRFRSWDEARRALIDKVEDAGVLVMRSGVSCNNNRRPLDPKEIKGFALSDDVAPLIFVNARDSVASQMFTVVHELAHVLLGQSGISDPDVARVDIPDERWCNMVAAEMLVPTGRLSQEFNGTRGLVEESNRLGKALQGQCPCHRQKST